ncbi:MAG: SusC/RagA family TonB-linked outer membrane protein [Bacteroidetes bacterium]|nr:SusC/RagA family TonB-linked outer membrane protein [Bacteroidota bacterium]
MKFSILKIGILVTCFLLSASAWAQNKTITGTIISDNGTPLAGVTISEKGKNALAASDDKGEFRISVPTGTTLVFTSKGFESAEAKVGSTSKLAITMITHVSKMDEVVVVGYGTQKRSKITGSVSKLDSKVLESGVRSNPLSALEGTIPGLRVQQTSGRPGSVASVVLRGGTTYDGSGTPLVIVDGILRSGFSDMNSDDIESMEVLKDAAATAIYGARASNGVILITTKRGKSGVSNITLNARYGVSKLNIPFKFLDARDYLYWSRMSIKNSGVYDPSRLSQLTSSGPFGTGNKFLDGSGNVIDGNKSSLGVWSTMILDNTNRGKLKDGWQTMIDPVYGDTLIFNSFDYSKYALRPSGITQDYNASMTGGNDKGKYYAGFGSYNELGFPINTFYNRITFVLNGDYKLKSWLLSSSSLNYARARWRDAVTNSEANYLTRSLGAPPTMRGRNENGDLLVGRDYSDGNPAVNDAKFIRNNQSDKFTLSQAFKVDFTKNLYLRASGNWYYEEAVNEAFNKDFLQSPGSINTTRSSSASFSRSFSQTYNAFLNYDGTVADKHHINLMAGSEFYDIYSNSLSASGSGAPTDDFMALGLTSSDQGKRSISSGHSRQRILSFFGRATYDYDNRYLLTGTFRRDGYSKLINNRWGDFPGISIGWNASNEKFFDRYKNIVNYLKLRASYGINGNVDPNQIGNYNLQGSYGTTRYNSGVGYLLSGLPFPNLLWERSKTYEFGLEATIINKFDVSVSIYNRKTDNKISSFNLPATAGYSSLTTNNGSMQNKGIEWDVNYRVLRSGGWKVDFSINGAYNANKILKLPANGLLNNRQGGFQVWDPKTGQLIWVGGYQEGQDPNVAYAYVAEDLYRTTADLAKGNNRVDLNGNKVLLGPGLYNSLTPAQQSKYYPIALGDVRWKDLDGNDTIDYRDRVYMGRTVPRYVGGFTASASWKNIFVSARFDYALGFVQYDGANAWFQSMAQGSFNTTEDVKNTYSATNTNAKFPTYYWADQLFKNNTFRPSSMFYHKGDYLAIREINIGYSLPKELASKIKSQGIDITLTGQNLGYLSKSTLFSPEQVGGTVIGTGGYPLPRTFIFALKFIF